MAASISRGEKEPHYTTAVDTCKRKCLVYEVHQLARRVERATRVQT